MRTLDWTSKQQLLWRHKCKNALNLLLTNTENLSSLEMSLLMTSCLWPCLVLFANASCSDNVTRARICSSGWLGSNEWQIQWHSTANPKTNFTMPKPRILLPVFGFQRRQSWSSHFPVQCLWLTRHQHILFNLHNLTHIASVFGKLQQI